MQTETLSVTRLTVVHPIRTSLSEARIRVRMTVERIVDTTPTKSPTERYRILLRTEHLTETLEGDIPCDWLWIASALPKWAFDSLNAGEDIVAVFRTVLGDLQQEASELPLQTRRIVKALWEGIDTTPVTA